jgi:hypothetical protein
MVPKVTMTDRSDLKENGRGVIEVLFRYLSGETEEYHENLSVRISGVPAKIRTEYLHITSLDWIHRPRIIF